MIGNIFSKALISLNMSEIKPIVNDIGIMTKADRCYFVEVDLECMGGKPIDKDSEFYPHLA